MFLQNCYLMDSSSEVDDMLDKIGYERTSLGYEYGRYTIVRKGRYANANDFLIAFLMDDYIDCGTNEDMFLALAALNDETDQYQWFVIDGKWHFCNYDLIEEYLHEELGEFDYSELHKATTDEIVEHFNNVGYVDC